MRRTIVLYNPPAVFWTMPLALVAVGSALVRRGYDVVVVDGRLDHESRLLDAIGDALCLGITVLTGQPLAEAMALTRRVQELRPNLPVVWGGWHPSLFPAACVEEGGATAAVVGQGEQTMTEIADRLASGDDLAGVAGCWYAGTGGFAVQNPKRPMTDLNRLASHDYRLIDVEAYFRAKGRRQLDFVTSQGCLFRCSFCADPAVFGRGWSGLDPERVLDEVDVLHRRFGMTDLAFQDETFFTNLQRVRTIARGFLDAGERFTWTATLRADQGRRMTDEDYELLRESGLRKVVLGVESGSPPTRTLRWDASELFTSLKNPPSSMST
jgi:radical SAM superfamily enzyme YgiQ (UPF0313 family)